MKVTLTCEECGSAISITPTKGATLAECDVCQHKQQATFNDDSFEGKLSICPGCGRKDFYSQKDFNRKIGVILFVIAAIASIWTYGISFIVLYVFDFLLHRKLGLIAICYNCQAVFREVSNIKEIHGFDHEMNDRIIYGGEDFDGRAPEHH